MVIKLLVFYISFSTPFLYLHFPFPYPYQLSVWFYGKNIRYLLVRLSKVLLFNKETKSVFVA